LEQSTFNSAGKQQNPSMFKKQRKTVTLLKPSSQSKIRGIRWEQGKRQNVAREKSILRN
jgi:hypothetical protein